MMLLVRSRVFDRLTYVVWTHFLIFHNSFQYEIDSGICGKSSNDSVSGRIVNGSLSKAGKWPWQVLMLENGIQICGGSLISEEWILTAAHCIEGDVNKISLVVGANRIDGSGDNALEVKAHLFFLHAGYDETTFTDDLCLIKLTQPVVLTKYIAPVCLPTPGTTVVPGDRTIATGWGDTKGTGSNERLREAVLPVLDTSLCKTWYGSADYGIPDKHFCAGYEDGGTDTCNGDSGGPLVHEETLSNGEKAYVLRGITSFGIGCAVRERPGVYVRVSEYLDWIDEKISMASSSSCSPTLSSACGGTTIVQYTVLKSPAETERFSYSSNKECKWSVLAPAGYWLRFKFICYFLLSPSQAECDDYLSITNETGQVTTFCGNELPQPYVVMDNVAEVVFSTNEHLVYPGFVMEIEFLPQHEEATLTSVTSSAPTSLHKESKLISTPNTANTVEVTTSNGRKCVSYSIFVLLYAAGSVLTRS